MKINPSLVSNIYKANTPAEITGEKGAAVVTTAAAAKTDTVVISRQGASLRETSRVVQTIARELDQEPSTERLEQLRQAIGKGEYRVPTEQLAKAILGVYA